MGATTELERSSDSRRGRLRGVGAVFALIWTTGYVQEWIARALRAYSRRAIVELFEKEAIGKPAASANAHPMRASAGAGTDLGRISLPPDVRVSHRRWRLVRADFSQMELVRTEFHHVRLSNTDWRKATLMACAFSSCGLKWARFNKGRIDETSFDGCELTHAWLTASFAAATFRDCSMDSSHAWRGSFRAARFLSCSMRFARADQADLTDATFDDCDLSGAWLLGTQLSRAGFRRCSLRKVNAMRAVALQDAVFDDCDLSDARLYDSDLSRTCFRRCSLRGADLKAANLRGAVFEDCDLAHARFADADLTDTTFARCDLRNANWLNATIQGAVLERCQIYGMTLWGTRGEVARARDLMLTRADEPNAPEVDGLHIAVFVASLLDGNGIRDLIDGPTSTMVLVLGRFSPPHKQVLDAIRTSLRDGGYSAIVFDSAMPSSRDTSETISVLAKLSRFVIADLSEPKSAPYELMQFVPDCRTPVLAVTRGERAFSMLSDLEKYSWVLPAESFADDAALLDALPALVHALEQRRSEVAR
jgi:uncharacterized protein YjbI with pentapeptide repeats